MDKLFGGQPASAPTTPTGTDKTPTPAPAATTPTQMSPWLSAGIPLLAGVASAASPAAARGVQGATHMMTALDKNQDPYGYKAMAGVQRQTMIDEHKTKQEQAQRKYLEQQHWKQALISKYPEHSDILKDMPEENVGTLVTKLMEPPTFNEIGLKGGALGFGKDPRRWTPEQTKAVDDAVKQDKLEFNLANRQQAAQVRIDMPAPGRGRGGGGDPGTMYTLDPDGNAIPIMGPDGKPLTAKGNKMITGTTLPERKDNKEDKESKDKEKLERDQKKQDRKDATSLLQGDMRFKLAKPEKKQQMLDNQIKVIQEKRQPVAAPAPVSAPLSPNAPNLDPLGWR